MGEKSKKSMLGGPLLEPPRDDVASAKMSASTAAESHSTDLRKLLIFIGTVYFFVMTMLIVPVACVATAIVLTPIMFFSMPLFSRIENTLCEFVNDHWVATAAYSGMTVTEYGTDVSDLSERRCLVLANHLGLLDHFIIMQGLHDKGTVPGRWMWVIYNIWKYTPLGLMWTMHGNFFVNGGASKREALLKKFKDHLKKYFMSYNYGWVVMYPEGSRFFLIKESGARFAEKLGLKPLKHCCLPRIGAAHAVLEVMAPSKEDGTVARCGGGPPMEFIIDVTLGYPRGDVTDLGSAIMGEWSQSDSHRLAIHYDVIPVDPSWADEDRLKTFLYERYQKKDELLDEFYRTGKFPGQKRPVVVAQTRVLASQIIWMGLFYVHYSIWIHPLCTFLFHGLLSIF